MVGVYGYRNILTNQWYIGQSVDIERRHNQHIKYTGGTKEFDKILRDNINDFEFVILKECSIDELNDYEKYYIKLYNANITGYNKTKGGKGHPDTYVCSDHHREALKKSWTEERKIIASITQRIVQLNYYQTDAGKLKSKHHSEVLKGIKWTKEQIEQRAKARIGRAVSATTRKKISEKNKGRKFTEEQLKRLSESHKGIAPGNKGKPCSEEQKRQISLKLKGRKLSEEHRKHISEGNKGRVVSEETRKKISCITKGKIVINNAITNKYIKPEELDYYISLGWKRGMKPQQYSENRSKAKKGHTVSKETRMKIANTLRNKSKIAEQDE